MWLCRHLYTSKDFCAEKHVRRYSKAIPKRARIKDSSHEVVFKRTDPVNDKSSCETLSGAFFENPDVEEAKK